MAKFPHDINFMKNQIITKKELIKTLCLQIQIGNQVTWLCQRHFTKLGELFQLELKQIKSSDEPTVKQYVLCVSPQPLLHYGKTYQIIPDASAEACNYVRVIDESGEECLYLTDVFEKGDS